MSQEAMMLIAAVVTLVFMWAAFVMYPRTVHESAFEDCSVKDSAQDTHPRQVAMSAGHAAPYGETSKKPVYVMLCISVEGSLRAVLPDTKALLAEMSVTEFQFNEHREAFAEAIAEGIRNSYDVDVDPIFYTTPLAHNVLPRSIADHPAFDMHVRTVKRLARVAN